MAERAGPLILAGALATALPEAALAGDYTNRTILGFSPDGLFVFGHLNVVRYYRT